MNFIRRSIAAALMFPFVLSLPHRAGAAETTYHLDIPAQNVRTALQAYSQATGRPIALFTGGAGINAGALNGDYTATEALAKLLEGTGFTSRIADDGSVIVDTLPADGSRVTNAVRVAATPGELASGGLGPNGSSDVTATEGTHSLTAQVATIGSKTPLALREITQSVSVITAKQIEDMNLETLDEVMDQVPGITEATGQNNTNNLAPAYYSRGYRIQNFQIDGGAPLTTGNSNFTTNFLPIYDMSMFDHVEVLRGASGLFGGVGDPGGMMSLERKRPLDHLQLLVDVEAGSWRKGRASIDFSTPLDKEGRFAVRTVLTWDSQHFFYETAKKKNEMAYVNFEAKLTPSTTVNLGTSFNNQTGTPWQTGLPRSTTGADLHLPRSTCLCTSWSTQTNNTNEYFVQLHQKLGEFWSVHAHVDANYQNGSYNYDNVDAGNYGAAADGSGVAVDGAYGPLHSRQKTADVNLLGDFHLFGHTHQLTLGVSYQDVVGQSLSTNSGGSYYDSGPYNVYTWNPSTYSQAQATSTVYINGSYVLKYGQTQKAVYATLRLNPFDPLHVTVGSRINTYQTSQATHYSSLANPTSTAFTERHTAPPFVGVSYDVTKTTSLYASYASIYNSNALVLTKDFKPLDPTTGINTEVGIKRADFGGALNSSMSVYYINQKNFPQLDQSIYVDYPNNYPANLPAGLSCCDINDPNSHYISEGVDLELSGALTPRTQLTASYTFNENKKELTNSTSPSYLSTFAPKHLVKLWATYRLPGDGWWRGFTVGGGGHLQSKVYEAGYLYTATGSEYLQFSQGGYAVADTMVSYATGHNGLVQLNINNVFDRVYYQSIGGLESGSWYGEPRNIMLSLKWKL